MPKGRRTNRKEGPYKGSDSDGDSDTNSHLGQNSGAVTPRQNTPGGSDAGRSNDSRASRKADASGSLSSLAVGKPSNDDASVAIVARIRDLLTDLSEKRQNIRHLALTGLISLLTRQVLGDLIEENDLWKGFIDALKGALRLRTTQEEASLSCQCIGLLYFSCHLIDEEIWRQVQFLSSTAFDETPAGERAKMEDSISDSVQVMAIISYSVACLVSSTEPGSSLSLVKRIEQLLSETSYSLPSKVICTLLHAWVMICSTSESYVVQEAARCLSLFAQLLDVDDVDVRVSAGENIAFVYEELLKKGATSSFENEEELFDTLDCLANEYDRHHTRKDQSSQRVAFRDICSFCRDQEPFDEQQFKFHDRTLTISSWSSYKTLTIVRALLTGEGLQVHVDANPLLSELFSISVNSSRLSSVEKRQLLSHSSASAKERSKHRHQQRDQRYSNNEDH